MRLLSVILLVAICNVSQAQLKIKNTSKSGNNKTVFNLEADDGIGNKSTHNQTVTKSLGSLSSNNQYIFSSISHEVTDGGNVRASAGLDLGGDVGILFDLSSNKKTASLGAHTILDPKTQSPSGAGSRTAFSRASNKSTCLAKWQSDEGDGSVPGGNQMLGIMQVKYSGAVAEIQSNTKIRVECSHNGNGWIQAIWSGSNNWWSVSWKYKNQSGSTITGSQLINNENFSVQKINYEVVPASSTVTTKSTFDVNGGTSLHDLTTSEPDSDIGFGEYQASAVFSLYDDPNEF